jgi:hypothetical protein
MVQKKLRDGWNYTRNLGFKTKENGDTRNWYMLHSISILPNKDGLLLYRNHPQVTPNSPAHPICRSTLQISWIGSCRKRLLVLCFTFSCFSFASPKNIKKQIYTLPSTSVFRTKISTTASPQSRLPPLDHDALPETDPNPDALGRSQL